MNRLSRRRWQVAFGILLLLALSTAALGGFAGGYLAAGGSMASLGSVSTAQIAPGEQERYALLDEIRRIVGADFLWPERTGDQALLYGAARGLVQALDDPNSVYETPEEREASESRWTGRYEGVGIMVDVRDGLLIVTAPIEGGPAAKAGILPGDVLIQADGKPLKGLSLSQQTRLLRGPKGTSVALTISREGVPGTQVITVIRDEVRLISARARMLPDQIGLLRLSQFTELTTTEAKSALESLLANKPRGLVLDLRSSPGGLLEPAIQVSGFFLGGGPVVLETRANGEQKSYTNPDGPPLTDLPMVVLIDRGTASASEVMSAALRDHGRAELIGEKSYGKSTVQYIHRLSEGSGLRITVARWHVPSGDPIPPSGLIPDHAISGPLAPTEGQDPVLEFALQRLAQRGG